MEVLGKEAIKYMSEKISKFEAISLIIIIVINEIVLNVPNIIILSAGSGAIINIIYVSIIAIIFATILAKLFKNFSGKDILDISEYLGGKYLKVIVGTLFIIFFLFLSALSTRYLCNSVKIIYFVKSPLVFLLLFFIIPSIIANKIGLKSISGINVIIVLAVTISLFFLLMSSSPHFDITNCFPIFGNGLNEVFLFGATNIFAFTGLAYLYFLPPLLKEYKDFKSVSVISTIISAICLILSIASLILALSSLLKTDEIISIYLITRMISVGNFLERLDAIFIFVWFLSLLSSLSLTFFYILNILKKITNIKTIKPLCSPLGFIVLGSSLFIKNYAQVKFWGSYVYRYYFIVLVFGVGLTILILSNIKYKKGKNNLS